MAMSKEQYQEWAAHPLTQQFHQYLRDYRQQLMDRWAQGQMVDSQDQLMAVARCQMADEIATLDNDSISEFYRSATKGEIDADRDPS